jgi:hypothetical protein
MYSDGELLKANATVVAGMLIFLTITPLSKGVVQIIQRWFVLITILITLGLFFFSVFLLSFLPSVENNVSPLPSRILFVAGLVGILCAVGEVMAGLQYQKL